MPRLPQKRGYHHGDLHRGLMRAALHLVEKRGLEAFTLREAARLTGVNHTAVYRHFADKDALLAAVAEEGFRLLGTSVDEAAAAGDALERARAMGLAYVDFALSRPAHFKVMLGPRLNVDGRFPSLEEAGTGALAIMVESMRRGIEAGEVSGRPMDRALSIWMFAHGYAELCLRRRFRVKPELARRYFAELLDPLILGMRA